MLGTVKYNENGEVPAGELIMFYHQEFVKALKAFGHMKAPPSLLDLNLEVLRHGPISVVIYVTFVPFAFMDWSKMSPEDMFGGEGERAKNFKKSLYEHPTCRKILQREMKNWLHKGWL